MGIMNSPQLKEFAEEMSKRYDYVFFDAPPIMGVSDASILSSMMDLTVLVIQYRKYPLAMNLRAKQTVDKVGGNLAGVVMNNINIAQDSYYYYAGYQYGAYGRDEEQAAAVVELASALAAASDFGQDFRPPGPGLHDVGELLIGDHGRFRIGDYPRFCQIS